MRLPSEQSLVEGECLIVPINHCKSSVTCDEEVLAEIKVQIESLRIVYSYVYWLYLYLGVCMRKRSLREPWWRCSTPNEWNACLSSSTWITTMPICASIAFRSACMWPTWGPSILRLYTVYSYSNTHRNYTNFQKKFYCLIESLIRFTWVIWRFIVSPI